ncbi:MAG: SLBB domain-containing protein [Armatimonadetes bacterium]|nr:SLBB domain-containing protein [Armatimonadota bacterium]
MARKVVIFLFLALAAFVWATPQDAKLAPGDRIKIACDEETTLNREYKVTVDGYVLVNFLGAVKVGGLTEQEAAAKIANQLVAEKIVKKATVALNKVGGAPKQGSATNVPPPPPVKFRGVCESEGEVPFDKGLTLGTLLKSARPKADADLTRVSITGSDGQTRVVDFGAYDPATKANDVTLAPGDTVTFISKSAGVVGKVKVLGQVVTPGDYDLIEGLKVKDMLAKAGGYGADADPTSLHLTRVGDEPKKLNLPQDLDMVLKAGDTVTVDRQLKKLVVKIEGFVRKTGDVELTEGMTLTEALKVAGGTTNEADTSKLKVFLPGSDKPRVIDVNDIDAGYMGDLVMQKGTRIQVPDRKGKIDSKTLRTAGAAAFLLFLVGI